MGVTFNVMINTHATTCYCCEALRKTKLEIDIDAAIEELGRTNPRRLKTETFFKTNLLLSLFFTVEV